MPSTSRKMHNFMALCAHASENAHTKCPPKSVSNEFMRADKGHSFGGKHAAPKKPSK